MRKDAKGGLIAIDINLIELMINLLLASFGGIVNKLVEKETHPELEIVTGTYVASACISLFVGVVVYFGLIHLEWPVESILAITALAGFIGYPVLYFLWDVSKKSWSMKGDGDK